MQGLVLCMNVRFLWPELRQKRRSGIFKYLVEKMRAGFIDEVEFGGKMKHR